MKIKTGYGERMLLSQYWYGQGDPLYAVVSRMSPSVDWQETEASFEEVSRIVETCREAGDDRSAIALLRRIGRGLPALVDALSPEAYQQCMIPGVGFPLIPAHAAEDHDDPWWHEHAPDAVLALLGGDE